MEVTRSSAWCLVVVLSLTAGCADGAARRSTGVGAEGRGSGATASRDTRRDSRPPPLAQPVPLWEGGRTARQVDAATASEHGYVLLDLGDGWTPYIFTERSGAEEPSRTVSPTYLALARDEFPDDRHGERAREDKYLELFGIPADALGAARALPAHEEPRVRPRSSI